jgi:hypothetical protein
MCASGSCIDFSQADAPAPPPTPSRQLDPLAALGALAFFGRTTQLAVGVDRLPLGGFRELDPGDLLASDGNNGERSEGRLKSWGVVLDLEADLSVWWALRRGEQGLMGGGREDEGRQARRARQVG